MGNKLVRQTWGSNKIDFAYDDQGRPYSLTYNGTTYYYVLNLQGDVIRIVNSGGNVAADYTYDAWGNVLSAAGTLADVNPLRYRGYVFDTETRLYYLNSRYYDPENRRFVNADGLSCLGLNGGIAGLGLFTYCNNQPVNAADKQGDLISTIVGAVVGGIAGALTADVDAGESRIKCATVGAISGLCAGAITDISVATGGTIGLIVAMVGNGAVSTLSSIAIDRWHGRDVDVGNAVLDGFLGAAFGAIAFGSEPVKSTAKSLEEVGARLAADARKEIQAITMKNIHGVWRPRPAKVTAKKIAKVVAFDAFSAASITGMQALYKAKIKAMVR